MKSFILTVLLFAVMHCAEAQLSFVQFIIVGLENEQQCRDIEAAIQAQSSIESVRVDSYSGNLLAFFTADSGYTESHFRQWLQALGYDFYCFKKGVSGQNPIVRLQRSDCMDELERK